MLTVHLLLVLLAFALTLVSGVTGKVPIWIPVLLITITLMLGSVVR